MDPTVIAVSSSAQHTFSKSTQPKINLIEGFGIEGDAHAGEFVKHRFLAKQDATRPNIRQVHLMHTELFEELNTKGFSVNPGELGENITTRGVDLLALPTSTKLRIGSQAIVELTALRNPCVQIDDFQKGLLKELVYQDEQGNLVRKAGVMGIILNGGEVRPGNTIVIDLPPEPHQPLAYIW
ncbi:MAG: MOSC domain-containing protein [Chloroflexi bacterium]|nr:MAG: MOSC domain-containing protein [Chloroflexota bacterium]MBL1194533.1 MOSC domain-containing protein [Chloroflexota bacterium]NOH11821.1 MOSC domain-containing protein [Chloroflexota bacterium]